MDLIYFRYESHIAQSWWQRRSFVHNWWRIYAKDPCWAPPHYLTLRRALEAAPNSHLARMTPLLLHTEALSRLKHSSQFGTASMIESPVAATVALCDPRRQDRTAYLALLRWVNEAECLARLLEYLAELLRARGYHKVIGPTGLSPHLGSGLLQDHWNCLPPLHSPYNPPYLPEVAESILQPGSRSQLYHLEIPPEPPPLSPTPAKLLPLEPARLATDLLPLMVTACPSWAGFVPPDAQEAAFLLPWLGRWPLFGWLAEVGGQPAGFVLLQPDLAPRLRLAKGGRHPLWRLWLAWAGRRPVRQGRVIFAAVRPRWQRQGIGRQLLRQAILTAQRQGWQNLSIGPLPDTSPGGKFLKHQGARARQTYLLYQGNL